MAEPIPKKRIALVVFDQIGAFHLAGPLLVFGRGGIPFEDPPFDLVICSSERGPVRTAIGDFMVRPASGLGVLDDADVVIVPGWTHVDAPVPPSLKAALRAASERGAVIVGLCLGVFVLASAGLLEGRRAATHWYRQALFEELFPGVKLDRNVLYARDGHLVTSAGAAAAIDTCLYVLHESCGAAAAEQAARRLISGSYRLGDQAQLVEQAALGSARERSIVRLLDSLRAHIDEPVRVDSLAERTHMTPRTFSRRFKRLTGTTVARWIQGQRLIRAQRLLEAGGATIEEVARSSGFGSAAALRKQFSAAFGVTPKVWRELHPGRHLVR